MADRLRINIDKYGIEKRNNESVMENAYEMLKRYITNQNQRVWLFVDDIDATFVNTHVNKIVVGTFFTACRYLVNSVDGLNIRASVRTDVWTILRNHDESLDKCEQYMIDLSWSTRDTGEILYNKIYSFFKEQHPMINIGEMDFKNEQSQRRIFGLVFQNALRWGQQSVIPYRAIHILGAGRPRWAAQLCKLAAQDAYNKHRDKIATGNINFAMNEYGRYRMADLYKEHAHQCAKIGIVIESFRNGHRSYTSKELIRTIRDKIINAGKSVYIDGMDDVCDEVQIGKFLYRIGFITLRNDEYNKALGLTRYEDDPYLFDEYNLEDDQVWEIHPAYRTILKIK